MFRFLLLVLCVCSMSAHAGRRDNIVSGYPNPSSPRHGYNVVTVPPTKPAACCAGNDVIYSPKPTRPAGSVR
jgi:hypothetical protein